MHRTPSPSVESHHTGTRHYPLTSDVVFKGVFGAAGSEPVLAALINAVRTDYGFSPDKFSIVDARVRDATNALFNVEVQSYRHKGLDSRILYYWARSYSDGLAKSEDWYTLKPVYGIAFLDLEFFPAQQLPHTCFELRERRTPQLVFSEDLAIHLLELPKYAGLSEAQPPSTPGKRAGKRALRRALSRAVNRKPVM